MGARGVLGAGRRLQITNLGGSGAGSCARWWSTDTALPPARSQTATPQQRSGWPDWQTCAGLRRRCHTPVTLRGPPRTGGCQYFLGLKWLKLGSPHGRACSLVRGACGSRTHLVVVSHGIGHWPRRWIRGSGRDHSVLCSQMHKASCVWYIESFVAASGIEKMDAGKPHHRSASRRWHGPHF